MQHSEHDKSLKSRRLWLIGAIFHYLNGTRKLAEVFANAGLKLPIPAYCCRGKGPADLDSMVQGDPMLECF
jgi:hypothetical protein